jgi:hypothetical protein
MTTVHDPTVYEMHFFAIPAPREGAKFEAICNFINEAGSQFPPANSKRPPLVVPKDLAVASVLRSERLAILGPHKESPGRNLVLEVRTLHDAVMLRTMVLREGEPPLAVLKDLRLSTPLPQRPAGLTSYLGAFRVRYAETDQGAGMRADVARKLAASLGWSDEEEPISAPVGTMLFATPSRPPDPGGAPLLDLIFIAGRDAAASAEAHRPHPFLVTLPELALCHLKVLNSAGNLRFHVLPQLAEREGLLRDLLPKQGEPRPSLQRLLERNDDITTRQAEVVDAVVRVRAELRTMRVNRDMFVTAASAPPFAGIADGLRQQLIDRHMRGVELQAENDLGYGEGTLQQAETHFKSIEASAEADQLRELRNINWWVIFLATLQGVAAVAALVVGIWQVYLAYKALPSPQQQPANGAVKSQ